MLALLPNKTARRVEGEGHGTPLPEVGIRIHTLTPVRVSAARMTS